ncbi:GNAT family N-acetyltransferase [Pontibacter cellulosilyticus]|uniref:GNAT family N-acetyltransferase n=1 Tax=Pontibacter cellulosilyticus TaxID=1720253 RepID=A0A923N6W7_9BACT|nr:GNAT family N-acetyltransferase [Pontibacter cellulosilyticus]MBC5993318.1 GNAT family N-acetyltransferase [Pontibacter cellulosilyticus]
MLTLTRSDSSNSDFLYLVQLLDEEVQGRYGEEHATIAPFNKLDNIQHVIVAFMNGEPAGCGAIKKYDEVTAEVKRMYVHPRYRGKGVAKAVLHALDTWAKELNYTFCILETGVKQPEAISLYTSSGYKQIPNYGQYATVKISLCFKKELI